MASSLFDPVGILAGGLAGCFEICLSYPFELTKTQLQISSQAASASKLQPKFSGLIDVASSTWRKRGLPGFYRGISSNLVFAFPRVALRFGVFNAFADWRLSLAGSQSARIVDKAKRHQPGAGLLPMERAAGGVVCGLLEASLIVTPMTTIQVKLIQDFNRATPHYNGLWHGIRTIAREEGLSGLYQGLGATLTKIALNQAIRFACFAEARGFIESMMDSYVSRSSAQSADATLPAGAREVAVSAGAGAISGAVSVVATQPFDTAKTNMQGLHAGRYRGLAHCLATTVREDGLLGLYKGVGPRLCRVIVEVSATFAAYDALVRAIDGAMVKRGQ